MIIAIDGSLVGWVVHAVADSTAGRLSVDWHSGKYQSSSSRSAGCVGSLLPERKDVEARNERVAQPP
jgi:hypothetical protein